MAPVAASRLPLLPTHFGRMSSGGLRPWISHPKHYPDLGAIPWNRDFQWRKGGGGAWVVRFCPPQASISAKLEEAFDRDLRLVLELATDEELFELENILYGPSYFSPLLKSLANKPDFNYIFEGVDDQQRENYIKHLESRFFFLAADVRFTLSQENTEVTNNGGRLGVGLSQWKLQLLSVLRTGAKEFQYIILKGGGMVTLSRILHLLSSRLSGKMILEAANYEIKREIIKRGGQMAAINLESRVALLAARKGLAGAASRYIGLRSLMVFLGPLLWGTLLADVMIQSLGTDYARILRAIYAIAQIRLARTYRSIPVYQK